MSTAHASASAGICRNSQHNLPEAAAAAAGSASVLADGVSEASDRTRASTPEDPRAMTSLGRGAILAAVREDKQLRSLNDLVRKDD